MKRIILTTAVWALAWLAIWWWYEPQTTWDMDVGVIEDMYAADYSIDWESPCELVWNPKPDITAYELALALNPIFGFDKDEFNAMPESVKRHFDGSCE